MFGYILQQHHGVPLTAESRLHNQTPHLKMILGPSGTGHPDAQQVVEGQRVGKESDEPVRAEHGRMHALPLQVSTNLRHLPPTCHSSAICLSVLWLPLPDF